jgi:hypothetical protein
MYNCWISSVAEGFRVYTDDVNKFQISIPQPRYIASESFDLCIYK